MYAQTMRHESDPTQTPDPIEESLRNFVDTLDPEHKKKLALQGTTGIAMIAYLLALSFLSQGDLMAAGSFFGLVLFTGAIAINTVRDEFRHNSPPKNNNLMQ